MNRMDQSGERGVFRLLTSPKAPVVAADSGTHSTGNSISHNGISDISHITVVSNSILYNTAVQNIMVTLSSFINFYHACFAINSSFL